MWGLRAAGSRELLIGKGLRLIFRVAAVLGILQVVVTATPVLHWWTNALSAPWGPDRGEVLVVLGGEVYAPDTLGISSYWRSYYAALTWRTGRFDRVIVTGKETAPLMADFLAGHGVARNAIELEPNATSTRENALFVARMLGQKPGRVVVLTSDFHSARSLWAFRRAGIAATALPFPDAHKRLNVWWERWSVFEMLVLETVKTVGYHVLYR